MSIPGKPHLASIVAVVALVLAAYAVPSRAERPEFDASAVAAVSSHPLQAQRPLASDPAIARLGRVAAWDEGAGVPNFLWAARPETATRSAAGLQSVRRLTPERAAREYLARLAPLYRIEPGDADAATLRYARDVGPGVIVAFRQSVQGIDVFRDQVTLLMNRDLELLAVSGNIPSRRLVAATGAPSFRLGARDALARVLDDFTAGALGASSVGALRESSGDYERADLRLPEGTATAPGRAPRIKRVLFHLGDTLIPTYYAEVMSAEDACSYVIAADDGRLLFRHNLVASDAYAYRVWTQPAAPGAPADGPQGGVATPHPTGVPDAYAPAFVAPTLATFESGPISTHDPWLPPAATQTTGNNVDAYADLSSPDGFTAGDLRASITGPGTFDHLYDTNLPPNAGVSQQMASITQLFYDTNFFHDWFYDAGFDEAAGNAQASNYGRGGLEGDPLHAEAQDYGGFNNANMATPADGESPRMQMYVFNNGQTWQLDVNAPASIAYPFGANFAGFGPLNYSVTGDVVLADDGTGTTSDACEPIVNPVAGKIAMIDRGGCAFTDKVLAAQNAGAIGAIIVDNVPGTAPPALPGNDPSITIPALSVVQADGNTIKARLSQGVNATLSRSTPTPRDGGIDNQIVAHEWGHYISNRLIGDANGLTTLQSRGLGEGWADFHALLMTVEPGDGDFSGTYSIGGYALTAPGSGWSTYYYGVRRCPYSIDPAKNALTLRHIQDGEPLPSATDIAGTRSGFDNAEPHNTGEVWCSMLWECYAALLRDTGRLTFDQARDRMRRYLVTAYEMTPRQPTLLEARDAVLAAAYASDTADYALFWQAFAKRGAGVGAVGPTRYATGNRSVTESYAVGGDLAVVSMSLSDDEYSCDHDGILDDEEVGRLQVTLANTGSEPLSSTSATVSSTNSQVAFPRGNTLTFAATAPFQSTTAYVDVRLSGATGLQTTDLHVAYGDPGLLVPGTRDTTLEWYANADESPSATETVEAPDPGWTSQGDANRAVTPWVRIATSPTSHRFYGADPGDDADQSLISPPLVVGSSGPLTLQFQHRYSFEADANAAHDGGVIEISDDDGATWTDIGASASPGYNGTLAMAPSNALRGRPAFVRTNPSYPALDAVSLNLGSAYAGKTVRIRFRIGADMFTGDRGWELDDLTVAGLTNLPFRALVADADACAPLATDDRPPRDLEFSLAGAHPIQGDAHFRIQLPVAARVRLAIYDVSGRVAAVLADGPLAAGVHAAAWSRNARTGAPSAGVFFARLTVGDDTRTVRFVALR